MVFEFNIRRQSVPGVVNVPAANQAPGQAPAPASSAIGIRRESMDAARAPLNRRNSEQTQFYTDPMRNAMRAFINK
jgi:hypothetical protein